MKGSYCDPLEHDTTANTSNTRIHKHWFKHGSSHIFTHVWTRFIAGNTQTYSKINAIFWI